MLDAAPEILTASLDIEQSLLGAMMLDARQAAIVAELVTPESFAEPFNGRVFSAICAANAAGRAVTPLTLAPDFAGEMVGDITAKVYLGRLLANGAAAKLAPEYAKALAETSARRDLHLAAVTLANDMLNGCRGLKEPVRVALDQIDTAMRAIEATHRQGQDYYDAVRDTLDEILNPNPTMRFSSGLAGYDRLTGGWHCGQLSLLAGRPGMGKSMLGVVLMHGAAKAGAGTMMFSFEMPRREIVTRGLTLEAYDRRRPIAYSDALSGKLTEDQISRLGIASVEQSRLPIFINDNRSLNLSEIGAQARRIQREWRDEGRELKFIIVDHIGLIRVSDRYRGNRVQEVAEISWGLAQLANELNVAILALSQLNRGVESRENKRPGLSDLRDSGNLEQDSHNVMFAYREAYYLARAKHDAGSQQETERLDRLRIVENEMELLVAKNRNGPIDAIPLYCDPIGNMICDLERHR